jgi:hypothetical protein
MMIFAPRIAFGFSERLTASRLKPMRSWRDRIARLNSNGSLDTSFDPGAGADADVRAIALQSDGNVLIAGGFTLVMA